MLKWIIGIARRKLWLIEMNRSLHHAHSDIHYFCKYINFWHFFFSKYFNLKNNITTVLTESCEIRTSTDIPNACRHIIVLYVSDTCTKLYMNNQYFVLYMTLMDNIVW